MGVKAVVTVKFGAVYSKKELDIAKINPWQYLNQVFDIRFDRFENTEDYILWASDSFILITNGYKYSESCRSVLELYTTEEVLSFIKSINDFVKENGLPQKTPEALLITQME